MIVLLVNTNRIRPPIGPVALDYIGAALIPHGHDVRLLDLCWEPDTDAAVARAFDVGRPDLVAVTFRNTDDCYFASGKSFTPVLKRDIAAVRNRYDGPIVIGGCGFSVMPESLLEATGATYGAQGEGEVTLPALTRALAGELAMSDVPGLVHRLNGAWQRNPATPADLAGLDLSPRETIDNARYFREGGQAGIETKRGCPGSCVYCADPVIKGRHARSRPPHDVVNEMRSLLAQGVDHFHLCDSEFNLPARHALDLCRAIAKAELGNRVRWYTYASPDPVSAEMIDLMKRAGCAGINFGVDHGSDAMLARLGRAYTSNTIRETARLCRAAGMTFMFDLLLGAPGETWQTIEETVSLMKALEPDCVGISLGVRLYPGTPLCAELSQAPDAPGIVGDPRGSEPAFYLSPALGEAPHRRIRELVDGDSRFFLPAGKDEQDYNYNDNSVLQDAITAGARGAYWDILRKLP